jgi:hypothetical protein
MPGAELIPWARRRHPAWSMRCFQAEVSLATRELRGRATIKFTQDDRGRSGFAARDEIEGPPARLMGRIFFEPRRPAAPRWCVRISNLIQTSVRNGALCGRLSDAIEGKGPGPWAAVRAGAWRRKGVRDAPPAKLTQSSGRVSSIVNAATALATPGWRQRDAPPPNLRRAPAIVPGKRATNCNVDMRR